MKKKGYTVTIRYVESRWTTAENKARRRGIILEIGPHFSQSRVFETTEERSF